MTPPHRRIGGWRVSVTSISILENWFELLAESVTSLPGGDFLRIEGPIDVALAADDDALIAYLDERWEEEIVRLGTVK